MAFAHMESAFAQCRLLQDKNQQNNSAAGFPSADRQREYRARELHSHPPPCLITEDCMREHAHRRTPVMGPDATS
jgi:hypothetical protein